MQTETTGIIELLTLANIAAARASAAEARALIAEQQLRAMTVALIQWTRTRDVEDYAVLAATLAAIEAAS